MARVGKRIPDLRVLVVFVALVLSACRSGQGEQQVDKARPLPETFPTIRPGTYSSEEFEPSLSFSVGKGWTIVEERSDSIWIVQGEFPMSNYGDYGGQLTIANVREAEVYESNTYGTTKVVPVPEDLVAWFHRPSTQPYMYERQPEPVTVGGVNGVQFGIGLGGVYKGYHAECGVGCMDLFRLSDGTELDLINDSKGRIVILKNVKGDTVVIKFDSPSGKFDDFLPKAQKVVDSMKWEGA